jgi:serine protease Do
MYRNSSANRSGLQLEDIITSVNGQEVGDAQQLQRMILDAKVGSTLKIGLIRDRRALTVNVPVEKMVPMNR